MPEREGAGREPGRTQATGFQIGVRRTLPIALEEAWLVTSPRGARAWLGASKVDFTPGASYSSSRGSGEVRVVEPLSHVRVTWQPPGWARPSTIQVRVILRGAKTTIAFHQEHLPDATARAQRKEHFTAVLDAFEESLVARKRGE